MSYFKRVTLELEVLLDYCGKWYEVNEVKLFCNKYDLDDLLSTIEDMNQYEYSKFLDNFH